MLRKILKITLSLLLVACCVLAVACATPKQPTGGAISISLHVTQLNLNEDDETALIVTTENFSGTVVWKSSNEKVVTVKDGLIKAEGEGVAIVTAKAGLKEAICTISVTGANYVPMLETNGYSSIEILEGNSFNVPLSFIYKGKEIVADSYEVISENSEDNA